MSASAIVIATDLSGARDLIPDEVHSEGDRAFQQTRCVYFATKDIPSRESALLLSGSASDGPVNHAIIMSNISKNLAPAGQHLISVSLVGEQAAQADAEAIRRQLKGWFGSGVDSWRELRSYHIKYALPSQQPGFYQRSASPTSPNPLSEGKPLICGDYCETTSVNGALKSGRLVAEHLIKARQHVESHQAT